MKKDQERKKIYTMPLTFQSMWCVCGVWYVVCAVCVVCGVSCVVCAVCGMCCVRCAWDTVLVTCVSHTTESSIS